MFANERASKRFSHLACTELDNLILISNTHITKFDYHQVKSSTQLDLVREDFHTVSQMIKDLKNLVSVEDLSGNYLVLILISN